MQYYIGTFRRIDLEVYKNGKIIYEGPGEGVIDAIDDKFYSKVLEISNTKIVIEV